jgi:hypothetical protein
MKATTAFLVLGVLALAGSCSPDLGVPEGYCENECEANWTPNCERDCGIPDPEADGGGAGGGISGIGGNGPGGRSGSGAGGSRATVPGSVMPPVYTSEIRVTAFGRKNAR